MSKTPCKRKREKIHPFFKQFQKKRAKKKRKIQKERRKSKNKNWEIGNPVHVRSPETFSVEQEENSNPLFEGNGMVDEDEEIGVNDDFRGMNSSFETNISIFRRKNLQYPEEVMNPPPLKVSFSPGTAKFSRIKQYLLGLEAGLRSIIFFSGEVGTGKTFVMNKLMNNLNVHEINDMNIGKGKIRQVFESTQSHGVQNQPTILLFENIDLFKYSNTTNQLKRLIDDTLTQSKIPVVFIHQPLLGRRNRNYLREQLNMDVTTTFEFKNLDLYLPRLHGRLPLDNLQQIILKQDLVLEYFHRHCIMSHLTSPGNRNSIRELRKEAFGEYFINMYRKELIPLGCVCCNDIRWMIKQLFYYGLLPGKREKKEIIFTQIDDDDEEEKVDENSNNNNNNNSGGGHLKEKMINLVRNSLGDVFLNILCIDRLVSNVLSPWTEFGIREVCEGDTDIARRKLNFFFLNYIQKEKEKEEEEPRKKKTPQNNNTHQKEDDDDNAEERSVFLKKCEFIDLYSELDCGYNQISPPPDATYGYDDNNALSFERRMTGRQSTLIQEKNYLLYGSFKHFCSNPAGFATTRDLFSSHYGFWRCEESVALANGVRVRNCVFEKQQRSFRSRVYGTMMAVLPVKHRFCVERVPDFVDFVDNVCRSENVRFHMVQRRRRFWHFFQQVLGADDFPVLSFWREEIRKKKRKILNQKI